jgi:hypothetical protein
MFNYNKQTIGGKIVLLLTYPLAIGIHFHEWKRMRKLQRIVRKGIAEACRNPKGTVAEIVSDASWELHSVYGK